MKYFKLIALLFIFFMGCTSDKLGEGSYKTVCNPVNLSYRFQLGKVSRREAADPSVIFFRDKYYLFASKSGGYWSSEDLIQWNFITTGDLPLEEYAPTAVVIEDEVYFLTAPTNKRKSTIYKTSNPDSGHWAIAKDSLELAVWDPALFLDEDKRLYLYWGCSNRFPLYGVELDYQNDFTFIGEPRELVFSHPEKYGWEVSGDYNTNTGKAPWIEGAWVNNHEGKYYLQYACPGTEFKSYADGVYVSDSPLGSYTASASNPFAYKPEGFACGAGHGSTFQDKYGNYWHMGTITISQKHIFERRLGLYPVFFDANGLMYTITRFGDYPLIIPQKKINSYEDIFPGWMLLSYNKKITVSSSVDSFPASNMTDEDIRTYWSSKSGNDTEWAMMDLGETYDVYAIQVNFADHETHVSGREPGLCYQYQIEYSNDAEQWRLLTDRNDNQADYPHDYIQLPEKVSCRYLKINNRRVADGYFALSDFRVFGKGNGPGPSVVRDFEVTRNPDNKRQVRLVWKPSAEANGYNIHFGTGEKALYQNYLVYRDTSVTINSLNANQDYYFTIESFNENGINSTGMIRAAR